MSLPAVQIHDFHIFLAVHYKFHKAAPERDSKLILHYKENFNTQTNNPEPLHPSGWSIMTGTYSFSLK